jgi:multiple sugar transport system permease protein
MKMHWPYFFLLPFIFFFVSVYAYPIFMAIYASLFKWTLGATAKEFIGLGNYASLLADEEFLVSLENTLFFATLYIPAVVSLSLMIALWLNQKFLRGTGIALALLLFPLIVPDVTVGAIWRWLLAEQNGVVNNILSAIGIGRIPWLSTRLYGMLGVAIIAIWRTIGYYTVMFLSGLQAIPQQYYEAASVDGATSFQRFRYITLPILTPIFVFVTSIATLNAMQLFTEVFIVTQGGPGFSTSSLVLKAYNELYIAFQFGKASAVSVIIELLVLVAVVVQIKYIAKTLVK